MQEDDGIIYLALCNQMQAYSTLLEEDKELSEENRGMAEYILSRTSYLVEEYAKRIGTNETIQRPRWEDITLKWSH